MIGLYQYVYGVACACVWAVDKYEGVMRRLVGSRRIASASDGGSGWCGARDGGSVCIDVYIRISICTRKGDTTSCQGPPAQMVRDVRAGVRLVQRDGLG